MEQSSSNNPLSHSVLRCSSIGTTTEPVLGCLQYLRDCVHPVPVLDFDFKRDGNRPSLGVRSG
jgi:hypothetical protein